MWKVSKSVNGSAHNQCFTTIRLLCQSSGIRKGSSILEKHTCFNSFTLLPLSKSFHSFSRLRVTSSQQNLLSELTLSNDLNCRLFTSNNNRRPLPSYVIPGTSAAAAATGLAQGTVTEKKTLVDDETLHRHKLRSWNFRRHDPTMVPVARISSPETTSTRNGISPEEITRLAENFLGSDRFSTKSSLSHNFGQFQQIISLFLLKVSDIDHPLLHITKIIESESSHLEENQPNPYPLWRAMIVLLAAEMFGFPKDIATAPPEVHWAIRDNYGYSTYSYGYSAIDVLSFLLRSLSLWGQEMLGRCHLSSISIFSMLFFLISRAFRNAALIPMHNLVGKIAEIMWIAHQLHRRILDVETISNYYLSNGQTRHSKASAELVDNIHKANKATTLIGDLLLTQKCAHLAALKSPVVTELICNSLADYCESEFDLGVKENNSEYFTYKYWLIRTELGLGSLLGHCLYSSLLFSGFNPTMRKRAFKLGSLLGVFYQAYEDIRFFRRKSLTEPSWLDVSTLPIVLHMQNNPNVLEQPHADIFHSVKYCESTMSQSLAAYMFFKEQVLLELASFDQLENATARDLLINFVHSLRP